MNYGKNLTGERKGTFSSLDVTGLLNIDNGSFITNGNIYLSGSMSASHAEFDELFADRFYCNQGSFNLIELDSNWVYNSEVINLSVGNVCFTTLNDVSQTTFSYIKNLNYDAQTQFNNVSLVTQTLQSRIDNVSTIANTALGSANSALSLINSVSIVAYAAYNNELALSEKVTGVKQDLSNTTNNVTNA